MLEKIFTRNDFTEEELSQILPRFKQVEFAKGDYLLPMNRTAHHYWFLESGFVRSFAFDPEGKDVTTHFYGPGDIVIDWPSFFMRSPTRENTQALTDCVGWQLDFESFQQLFHSIEAFREAGRGRLVKSYFELKRHHLSMVTDTAKDRYLKLIQDHPAIVQNVSLKQIASYLGITDTSLSRIRKEIAEEK